jgi:hypothetical protein
MRKSFVALALLVGAVAMLTTSALAQEGETRPGMQLSKSLPGQELTRASRLQTAADADTLFVGHSASVTPTAQNPFAVGTSTASSTVLSGYNGVWDFDHYNGGAVDSLQGWFPIRFLYTGSYCEYEDYTHPWWSLDFGNRINQTPVQGRTIGVIGAWHVDGGGYWPVTGGQIATAGATWKPLGGSASAWCGLRAGRDLAAIDDVSRGGTGNPFNGDVLWGNRAATMVRMFPGYPNMWDQMLYRDVRVATGGSLTVSFKYQTYMDTRATVTEPGRSGWFDLDPMSMNEGSPTQRANFISASHAGTPREVRDSFMVYVGVPTNPTACMLSDGTSPPIYDLKRRWFSEVLKIDAPSIEILTTAGKDSAYRATPKSVTIDATTLAPLLAGQAEDGGVVRIVFRVKTNRNNSDESGPNTAFSNTEGAVRIDDVSITGGATTITSGFETPAEIDNRIEPANADTPGPAVGEGYALAYWHATGKPPKVYPHTHPIAGGNISTDPLHPNVYSPLAWNDLCGGPPATPNPLSRCDMTGVVVSTGDHDNGEELEHPGGGPFQDNMMAIVSPTISLITPPSGPNLHGIDAVHATTNAGWWIWYDRHMGVFDASNTGVVWTNDLYCYPVLQTNSNNAKVWSDFIPSGYITNNSDQQCAKTAENLYARRKTSNSTGLPDSIKIVITRWAMCSYWCITNTCGTRDGDYIDNVRLCLPPPVLGGGDAIYVDMWDWNNDTFPVNESVGYPGVAARFDTCAAHIKIGLNTESSYPSDDTRFNIPGDSVTVTTTNSDNQPARVDMVFRILPGPGNYVTVGNRASGLRAVPSDPAPASSGTTGASAFWKTLMANPGEFAKGDHSGGWNVNTWNSIRMDTLEINRFPWGAITNPQLTVAGGFQGTIHEADIRLGTVAAPILGIPRNICFAKDPLSTVVTDANITCSGAPAWVLANPTLAGYNNVPTTVEYTKIIPDGLLTPGSHVQYFIRMSKIGAAPTAFAMTPDTNMITPQANAGNVGADGDRWAEFGVLPDRWKAAEYGGIGSACMLVVDMNDDRGEERSFVSVADSIGLTKAAKYGAHNGWHCDVNYIASDGSHDYTNEVNCGQPPIAVFAHGGLPGTLWDMYQIKGAEGQYSSASRMGGRLANRADMGLNAGMEGHQGPTPEMLRTYYKLIFWMSGDLNADVLGQGADFASDDLALLEDFLSYNASVSSPRGFWASGNGFAESETKAGTVYGDHTGFLSNFLATTLRDASFYALQGQIGTIRNVDLTPSTVVTTSGNVYSVENSCLYTDDVLDVNYGVPGASMASSYEAIGAGPFPYISGVYAPAGEGHKFVTLVDGFDIKNMFSRGGGNTAGRLQYFANVLVNVFGSVCPFVPELTVDVPTNTIRNVDFLGNVWGNPMAVGGSATVHFGLAKADRVEIKVYDVTGRLVKSLADRNFGAGEHALVWDGSDDQGRTVARGVYFTQVRYINSRFVDAKKVTVLK